MPPARVTPPSRGASPTGAGGTGWTQLFAQPEAPYPALGVAALAVVLLAAVAYLRRGRQR